MSDKPPLAMELENSFGHSNVSSSSICTVTKRGFENTNVERFHQEMVNGSCQNSMGNSLNCDMQDLDSFDSPVQIDGNCHRAHLQMEPPCDTINNCEPQITCAVGNSESQIEITANRLINENHVVEENYTESESAFPTPPTEFSDEVTAMMDETLQPSITDSVSCKIGHIPVDSVSTYRSNGPIFSLSTPIESEENTVSSFASEESSLVSCSAVSYREFMTSEHLLLPIPPGGFDDHANSGCEDADLSIYGDSDSVISFAVNESANKGVNRLAMAAAPLHPVTIGVELQPLEAVHAKSQLEALAARIVVEAADLQDGIQERLTSETCDDWETSTYDDKPPVSDSTADGRELLQLEDDRELCDLSRSWFSDGRCEEPVAKRPRLDEGDGEKDCYKNASPTGDSGIIMLRLNPMKNGGVNGRWDCGHLYQALRDTGSVLLKLYLTLDEGDDFCDDFEADFSALLVSAIESDHMNVAALHSTCIPADVSVVDCATPSWDQCRQGFQPASCVPNMQQLPQHAYQLPQNSPVPLSPADHESILGSNVYANWNARTPWGNSSVHHAPPPPPPQKSHPVRKSPTKAKAMVIRKAVVPSTSSSIHFRPPTPPLHMRRGSPFVMLQQSLANMGSPTVGKDDQKKSSPVSKRKGAIITRGGVKSPNKAEGEWGVSMKPPKRFPAMPLMKKKLLKVECEVCHTTFRKKTSLTKHLRIKHRNMRECRICHQMVKVRGNQGIRYHTRAHRRLKSHVCKDCSEVFPLKHHLRNHRKLVHGVVGKEEDESSEDEEEEVIEELVKEEPVNVLIEDGDKSTPKKRGRPPKQRPEGWVAPVRKKRIKREDKLNVTIVKMKKVEAEMKVEILPARDSIKKGKSPAGKRRSTLARHLRNSVVGSETGKVEEQEKNDALEEGESSDESSSDEELEEEPKKYFCDTCDAGFSHKFKLKHHRAEVHSPAIEPEMALPLTTADDEDSDVAPESKVILEPLETLVGCPVCAERFRNKYKLRLHLGAFHPGVKGKRGRKPKVRGDATALIMASTPGIQRKGRKRKWEEQDDGSESSSRELPSYVVRVGNGYECLECQIPFKKESFLTYHLKKVHETTYPFRACPHCARVFRSQGPFMRHLLSHAVRSCPVVGCRGKFRKMLKMKAHQKSCHPELPHRCPKCVNVYAKEEDMQKHYEEMHPKVAGEEDVEDEGDDENSEDDEDREENSGKETVSCSEGTQLRRARRIPVNYNESDEVEELSPKFQQDEIYKNKEVDKAVKNARRGSIPASSENGSFNAKSLSKKSPEGIPKKVKLSWTAALKAQIHGKPKKVRRSSDGTGAKPGGGASSMRRHSGEGRKSPGAAYHISPFLSLDSLVSESNILLPFGAAIRGPISPVPPYMMKQCPSQASVAPPSATYSGVPVVAPSSLTPPLAQPQDNSVPDDEDSGPANVIGFDSF